MNIPRSIILNYSEPHRKCRIKKKNIYNRDIRAGRFIVTNVEKACLFFKQRSGMQILQKRVLIIFTYSRETIISFTSHFPQRR
jgi:hypothetical protein